VKKRAQNRKKRRSRLLLSGLKLLVTDSEALLFNMALDVGKRSLKPQSQTKPLLKFNLLERAS
jgi:hypothetical protein